MSRPLNLIAAGLIASCASPLLAGPAEEKAVLASRSPKRSAEFAAELLAAARKAPESPAFQAYLCEKAYAFGLRGAAGYPAAAEAARMLAEVAPARKTQAQDRLLADVALKAIHPQLDKLAAADLKTIVIEALVDGESELWITPRGLFWKSGSKDKPGLPGRNDEPTWVNGLRWTPVWGRPDSRRGPDRTEPLEFPIGTVDDLKVDVIAVATARHVRKIERRSPVTTKRKGDALIVRIPDSEPGE